MISEVNGANLKLDVFSGLDVVSETILKILLLHFNASSSIELNRLYKICTRVVCIYGDHL